MKPTHIITCVIITKNRHDDLETCIEYVKCQSIKSQIIIVDNSFKINESLSQHGRYIYQKIDPGPTASCNIGLNLAKTEFVCILDDDCFLIDKSYFEVCLDLLEANSKIGAICGQVRLPSGNIQFPYDLEAQNGTYIYNTFIGCSTIFRKSSYLEAGGYDELFFIYDNEPDLAMRIREKGYLIISTNKCYAYHKLNESGRTNKRTVFFMTRNSLIIILKNIPKKYILGYLKKELQCKFHIARQNNSLLFFLKGLFSALFLFISKRFIRNPIKHPYFIINMLCHKTQKTFLRYEHSS